MAKFPYITNASKLTSFLDTVQKVGVPDKVTYSYLESLGYKSKNDRPIVSTLKTVGFLDSTGKPTERWKDYRDKKKARAVLAQGVKEGYSDLFAVFSDAHRKDDEAIKNFFTSNTSVSEGTVRFMVTTFKALVGMGDFENLPIDIEEKQPADETIGAKADVIARTKTGMTININIELSVPATDDEKVYENFFAAMRKHLIEGQDE